MATLCDPILSQLRVSDGENAETLKKDVDDLVSAGWKIDNEGMGLEASFNFPTFTKAAVRMVSRLLGPANIEIGFHGACLYSIQGPKSPF